MVLHKIYGILNSMNYSIAFWSFKMFMLSSALSIFPPFFRQDQCGLLSRQKNVGSPSGNENRSIFYIEAIKQVEDCLQTAFMEWKIGA